MDAKESPREPSPVAAEPCLDRNEQCPLCGRDNHCRVAKGQLYKGPCWCHEIIVPNHILTRLAENSLDPACLCRLCLETIAHISHGRDDTDTIIAEVQSTLSTAGDYYLDADGNTVFTAQYHLKRGNCCDSGCRHCPY